MRILIQLVCVVAIALIGGTLHVLLSADSPSLIVPEGRYANALICDTVEDETNGGEEPPPPTPPTPPTPPPPEEGRIGLADAFAYWEEGAIFIDARRKKEYVKGHIPGAISISPWENERELRVQELAENEVKELPVVIYCTRSKDCEDSEMIADDLRQLDFVNVLIFQGGWP